MELSAEQRVAIKFCVKLNKTASETHEMLQLAYKEAALSRSRTFEWHKRFKKGRESTQDDHRSGRPKTSKTEGNIEVVKEKILSDRRLTIREVADDTDLAFATVQSILTEDLGMRRVSAKFIPKLLTDEQKEARVQICADLLETSENDPDFIRNIITGDESWVYGYDPETKSQSSQWKSPSSPRPKKARMSRSNVKAMLTVFFDYDGIIHYEFAPPGQTVTQHYYLEVLRRLREKIRRKRPEKWADNSFVLHHDNAPAHSAHRIKDFLAKTKTTVINHPAYSPDLAPCDYFLFPKLKFKLKGRRFEDVESIKSAVAKEIGQLPQEVFQNAMEKLRSRWNHCIDSEGMYFEGDKF